jgi:hypothetical protein
MKVVINADFGGFSLSDDAMRMYSDLAGLNLVGQVSNFGHTIFYLDGVIEDESAFWEGDIPRDDENLVKVVETLGSAANGNYSRLKVVEIPDGVNWFIEEYDGREHVAERHRTWE